MRLRITVADRTKKIFADFEQLLGKGAEDGIKQMAQSAAISLARKTRPYGLNQKVGKKFMGNIARQVDFAAYAVRVGNAYGAQTLAQGHEKLRKKGRIRIRHMQGTHASVKIPAGEVASFTQKKQEHAGRAKGGWIFCALQFGAKVTGVGSWIKRHAVPTNGQVYYAGKGRNLKVAMNNRVAYMSELQSDYEVQRALADGRKNGLLRMKKQIESKLKKLKQ